MKKQKTELFLIEDSDPYRIFVQRSLEQKGYRVHSFQNGEEAYEMLHHHRPEAIISDIEMPKMDGFAFREAMSTSFPDLDIPFVYITSREKSDKYKKALKLGVKHCFYKPLKMPSFLKALENILSPSDTVPQVAISFASNAD